MAVAIINNQLLNSAFFMHTAAPRGVSKVKMVNLPTTKMVPVKIPEMMSVARAYRLGLISEDRFAVEDGGATTIIKVEVIHWKERTYDHYEPRVVDVESKLKGRATSKPEEIISALQQHPLLPGEQIEAMDGFLRNLHEKKVTDRMPRALVFLKNVRGEAQVKESFLVHNWTLDGADVEDINGNMLHLELSPEVTKHGVTRDFVMYLPAFVELQ